MKKIYNDKSNKIPDWTTKKLKQEAKNYHEIIYVHVCYSTRDIRIYDSILNELFDRGIEPKNSLTF